MTEEKNAEVMANVSEESETKKSEGAEPRIVDPEWHDQVSRDLKKFKSRYSKLSADIEAKEKSTEEKRLKEKGDYKKLEENYKVEIELLKAKIVDKAISEMLYKEASKAGLVDMDYLKLVDKSSISIDEDGSVIGAKEAVDALKSAKALLFQKSEVARTDQVRPQLGDVSEQLTPEAFVALSLEEKMILREKSVSQYESLYNQARLKNLFRRR